MCIEESMVNYYARRAHEYELVYQKPERQAELVQLRSLVESAFAGVEVLEVACGTGYWTEILARSAASVVATDISEEVLAIARSKRMDPRRVTFRKENAYELQSMPRHFAASLSAFWWSHVPRSRIRGFVQGLHQTLSRGAKVVFLDNVYVEGSSTPISRTDERGDSWQIRKLDDGSVHEVRKNFPTEPELRAAVEGLASDVRVRFLRYYWILSYVTR